MTLAALLERAGKSRARLLLAGGDAGQLEKTRRRLEQSGFGHTGVIGTTAFHPTSHPRLADVAALLRQRKPEQVRDGIHALDLAADPIRFAGALVAIGDADAVVAGAGVTPQLLAESASWIWGNPPDGGPLHSVTWLATAEAGLVAFADCALAGSLTPQARARLAGLAAGAHQALSGEPARVAFLEGPPTPDANGAAQASLAALERTAPGILAEVDSSVRFRGRANVLIFPCGTSAYLASRTARATGGVALLGPFLLGIRGVMATAADDATDDEMVGTAALAVLLAGQPET